MDAHHHLLKEIRHHAIDLADEVADYTELLDTIGEARFVLIGEATHGTEEFYRIRILLTRMLISYYGFSAVAVEGDWPDCDRVNRYVRGDESLINAENALAGFTRFPAWMWRNEAVTEFLQWLRDYNSKKLLPSEKVGFYGLDLYSLNASIEAVIRYLDKVDPPAGQRARQYYGCFNHYYAKNPQEYGYAASFGLTPSCEKEVIQQLSALHRRAHDYLKSNDPTAEEDFFSAAQNAKVIMDAEHYYRTMFQGRVSSWNIRDQHMCDTLNALAAYLSHQKSETAKIVVWAHNSHIGDARATEMGERGEWNIGQLVRQQHGEQDTRLIGFSTYHGSVTAASRWDGHAERKTVRPAMAESYERLFHETGLEKFCLLLRENETLHKYLHLSRLQRAIGVLYLPETERQSHYFFSRLAEQFDAIIHIDKTTALKPLEPGGIWHQGEMFETYPSGL